MYQQALAAMSPEERLPPDGVFKPNLVNSVTYFVEAFIQVHKRLQQGAYRHARCRLQSAPSAAGSCALQHALP